MFYLARCWWMVLLVVAAGRVAVGADEAAAGRQQKGDSPIFADAKIGTVPGEQQRGTVPFSLARKSGQSPASQAPVRDTKAVDYGQAVAGLERVVQEELERGILGGVSIALVDDQRIVLAKGYGLADKRRKVPATEKTVYRAGSISKLFTAIAAMQLVEQGKLDIDRPVSTYDPQFHIVVPFADAKPIVLRQLMCHRSGMVREAPVGGYLDPGQPGIAATVASIADCVLVYPPEMHTKYSNVGPTITGHVVELVAGMPFAEYEQRHVLGPLGMESSSFLMNDRLRGRLAPGNMQVADGRGGFYEIEAPLFELGTLSAGNLYTTAEDLARFLKFLFAEGRAGDRQVLKAETLEEMFSVQLSKDREGFGLAFQIEHFAGQRTVGHMGMVYGHTALVRGVPAEKIGVVVLSNEDIAGGPVRKLGEAALGLMLEAKLGQQPPAEEKPLELPPAELASFAGDYESESYWAKLEVDQRVLRANISGQRLTLTPVKADEFLAEGRFSHAAACKFRRDDAGAVTGFGVLEQEFRRVDPRAVPEVPEGWNKFLGSYGPEFIPLIVSVKHGHLYAMTENMIDYRLRPLNRTVFTLPPGMYVDEQLVFRIGPDGKVFGVIMANMMLGRR